MNDGTRLDEAWLALCTALVRAGEGCVPGVYFDTAVPPRLTFGIGRNLTDRPLTPAEWKMLHALHTALLAEKGPGPETPPDSEAFARSVRQGVYARAQEP